MIEDDPLMNPNATPDAALARLRATLAPYAVGPRGIESVLQRGNRRARCDGLCGRHTPGGQCGRGRGELCFGTRFQRCQ